MTSTREKLVAAAQAEFAEKGWDGTHSNAIARRAGFAPQTFYRHFADKLIVFVEVYETWQAEEARFLGALLGSGASDTEIASAVAGHHRAHVQFRRDLRRLAVETDVVRRARAESRARQLDLAGGDRAIQAARLLQVERLADALAEGEFADLGLAEDPALDRRAGIIGEMRAG